jgi:hypothetical protein
MDADMATADSGERRKATARTRLSRWVPLPAVAVIGVHLR